MIRAVLFDFNGVIVDDEPIHLRLFQKVLEEEGVRLTKEDYYGKYLGMDDHDCFASALRDHKVPAPEEKIQELIERKAKYYEETVNAKPPFVPGVLDFIKKAESTHFLAVVSGALRREIDMLLAKGAVKGCFSVILGAEDIPRGKPDPAGYEKAFQLLNRDFVASSEILLPSECLVIEDSSWGIEAARRAAMPCLAVTTSYSEKELPGAAAYIKDFQKVEPDSLLGRIAEGPSKV